MWSWRVVGGVSRCQLCRLFYGLRSVAAEEFTMSLQCAFKTVLFRMFDKWYHHLQSSIESKVFNDVKESRNSSLFLSFKLSSAVLCSHLAHPLSCIWIKRSCKRCEDVMTGSLCPAQRSDSTNRDSRPTDAIPPLTTVWVAIAEKHCLYFRSLIPHRRRSKSL